jgi:all-trans-retinol dehydrogenase (NAD+)
MIATIILILIALIIIANLSYRLIYPKRNLAGKVVLITGAGRGIGRLQAEGFARLGCRLILWDINREGLEDAEKELSKLTTVTTQVVNVMDRDAVYSAGEAAGAVDILVNNAGIVIGKPILKLTDADIDRTITINATSHFWTIKAFLPGMIARNYGHIVGIASQAGVLGVSKLADYCASKHAVVGLMEALMGELGEMKANVRTTTIRPLFINTGMFEGASNGMLGPMLNPAKVANRIVEAVQRGEEIVDLPPIVGFIVPFLRLLPMKIQILLFNVCGVATAMQGFKGA